MVSLIPLLIDPHVKRPEAPKKPMLKSLKPMVEIIEILKILNYKYSVGSLGYSVMRTLVYYFINHFLTIYLL